MACILFDEIVFGPVISRRLGISLGINLLPFDRKVCTFNCIYCECGWTKSYDIKEIKFPSSAEVKSETEKRLAELRSEGSDIDTITFAGNGEPTIHPEFHAVIEDTISLRNKYFPDASITVLSNSTMLKDKNVFDALQKVDNNFLKLDAGTEQLFQLINNPVTGISLKETVAEMKKFNGNLVIQSLFLKGEYNGKMFDNTSPEELDAWVNNIKEIMPRSVMIYTF